MEKGIHTNTNVRTRLRFLDAFRGLTILSMIAFHTCWDLMDVGFGMTREILYSPACYVWQQSICWSFIFLSGYCFTMGKHPLKRGLITFGCGVLVSLVTILVMYENRAVFGVLWMIGISCLMMIPIDRVMNQRKSSARHVGEMGADATVGNAQSERGRQMLKGAIGLVVCIALFVLFRNVNRGYLGFEGWRIAKLPDWLYQGYFMTFLGFTDHSFYSTDYFSVIPWFFLYGAGYFTRMLLKDSVVERKVFVHGCRPLEFLGRHSLLIYMLHQPVAYGCVYLLSLAF